MASCEGHWVEPHYFWALVHAWRLHYWGSCFFEFLIDDPQAFLKAHLVFLEPLELLSKSCKVALWPLSDCGSLLTVVLVDSTDWLGRIRIYACHGLILQNWIRRDVAEVSKAHSLILAITTRVLEGRWWPSHRIIIATSSRWDHHCGLEKLLCSCGSLSNHCSRPANRALLDKLSKLFSTSAKVVVNLDQFLNLLLSERSSWLLSKSVSFMMRESHRYPGIEVSPSSWWEIVRWVIFVVTLQEMIDRWDLTYRVSIALKVCNLNLLVLISLVNVRWLLNWSRDVLLSLAWLL